MPNGDNGQAGTRPKVGFSPTMPQKPAGMRIEPPPSVPRCSGAHAEGRRDRRPAARAAGGAARVPRVARDLAQRVVGHRLPAELGRGGLAEQHRAGLAQPRGGGRVLSVRRGTGRRPAAAPGREAAHQDDVLDRRRHAVEGPAGLAAAPSAPRMPARPRGRPRDRPRRTRRRPRSSARSGPGSHRPPRPATARAAGTDSRRSQAERRPGAVASIQSSLGDGRGANRMVT